MSFSKEIKHELSALEIKPVCCRRAAADGIWQSAKGDGGKRVVTVANAAGLADFITEVSILAYGKDNIKISSHCGGQMLTITAEFQNPKLTLPTSAGKIAQKCQGCVPAYLRGVFLAHGRMTAPGSGYHLEFDFEREADAVDFADFVGELEQRPKMFFRNGKFVVYYKESGAIEDFMAYLGSNRAAFDIMNSKIERQLRNDANRYSNCEAANLVRAVTNSQRHIAAIRTLEEMGKLSQLSSELIETAKLRLENPELTLTELSKLTNPPVSKSGLNHRLGKIIEYAKEYKKQ